jgi:hypothetical protein
MPTPLLRGHVPGMGDSMPSERRAGHATLDEQGLPQNLGTPGNAPAKGGGMATHPPPSFTSRQQPRLSHFSKTCSAKRRYSSALGPYFTLSAGVFWISPAMSTMGLRAMASPRRLSV